MEETILTSTIDTRHDSVQSPGQGHAVFDKLVLATHEITTTSAPEALACDDDADSKHLQFTQRRA